MALTTNLVAYWKLDGNSNDAVGSKNGSDTSITYGSGNGIIGQGAGFSSASSSKITFGNGGLGALVSGAGQVTASLWFKASSRPTAGNRKVFSSIVVTTNNQGMLFGLKDTNTVEVGGRSNGSDAFQSVTYTDGTGTGSWVHVVGIWDFGSAKVYLYYNGSLVVNGTAVTWSQGSFGYAGNSSIPDAFGEQNSSSFYDGALDEVGLWTRALTGSEVTQLYNGGAGLQYPFAVNVTVSAPVLSASFSIPASTQRGDALFNASVLSAAFGLPSATVFIPDTTQTPGALSLSVSIPSIALITDYTLTVSPLRAALSLPVPTVTAAVSQLLTPSPFSLLFTLQHPGRIGVVWTNQDRPAAASFSNSVRPSTAWQNNERMSTSWSNSDRPSH
jgi:hypothetical protein